MRSRLMKSSAFALLALAAAIDGSAQTPPVPAAPGSNVTVTVNYTGKGVVDDKHALTVFLFASPELTAQSRPIGPPQAVFKNNSTVTFSNVTTSPVYVVAVYSEAGGYVGTGGPPPIGTPITHYRSTPKSPPTAVTPGPKTTVKISFGDGNRWKGN